MKTKSLKPGDRVTTWNGNAEGTILEFCNQGVWVKFDNGVVALRPFASVYKLIVTRND